MRIRGSRTLACLALASAWALSLHAQENKAAGATIQVRLNYTGSGTVDEAHKIYVALWDNPDFTHGQGAPVAVESTASKNGTVTFSNVTKLPAYVSAAFDPTGKWDARSQPPAGSSLGMYSKTPGKPEPIEPAPGHTAEAEINFDDTVKVK